MIRITDGWCLMASLEKRNIESPDEMRPFRAHGHADVVTIGDFTLGRAIYEPGWKWSEDVKPVAGTDSCRVRHTGICLSGNITVRANDGTEETYRPGDVFVIEPGHDAWVDGSEPCVLLDTGMAPYAKPVT
jgi:Cupin domain